MDVAKTLSLILAKYLHAKRFGIPYIVCGYNDTHSSHAWIIMDDWIIDITADQFDEITEKVIVTKNSKFHDLFNRDIFGNKIVKKPYNQILADGNWINAELFRAYSLICETIRNQNHVE